MYAVHPVCLLVRDTSRCLVDVWLEESHDRSNEVPGEIDACKEADSLDRHLVRKEHGEGLQHTAAVALCLLVGLARLPFGALLKLPLHVPCYESHHEEREEDKSGTENLDGFHSGSRAKEDSGKLLNPSEEIAIGSEEHAQQEDYHRSDTPRHLRDADVTAAVVDFRTFRDIRP